MSPAKAWSTWERSWARNCTERERVRGLPVRRCWTFIPRSKRPEHTRRNAMRSRCWGSMFAWILNTKPENASAVGATSPSSV